VGTKIRNLFFSERENRDKDKRETMKKELQRPNSCILLLTLRCHLQCKMCYLWTNKDDPEQCPSFDEWRAVIDSIDTWAEKPFTIIFGGGEPLLYKERLAALIQYAHEKGFRTSLATSGYDLDKETVRALANAGLDYLALTLYSLKPKTQDFLRGVPGSLRRVKKAIKWFSLYGPQVEIAIDTVLMGPNMREVIDLTRWVQRSRHISRISFQTIMQPFHTPPEARWYETERYRFLWPQDVEQMCVLIDQLKEMKACRSKKGNSKIANELSQLDVFKEYFRNPDHFIKHEGCPVFDNGNFGIAPDGSITLCPYMQPIGNIRQQALPDVWTSEEARARRSEIRSCAQNCHHIMNCWYEEEPANGADQNGDEHVVHSSTPRNDEAPRDKNLCEEEIKIADAGEDDTKKNSPEPPAISQPKFCDITITTKCMLKCKMCKAWQNSGDGPHLSFDDAKRFVDELASFVKPGLEINVMGGEPLSVPWCLDLCDYISEKGFRSIISTNAYLIDENMARRIADSKLTVLALSLESLRPEMHDENRGCKGLHKRVMQAIEYLDTYCRGKLTCTVLSIIMEKNLDDIIPLAEWVGTVDLFENISYLALLETGIVPGRHWFRDPYYKDLWPQDKAKLDSVIDQCIRMRTTGSKIWNPLSQLDAFKEYYDDPVRFMQTTPYALHDYIIDLDEKKNIYVSGETLGSLDDGPLKEAWTSDKAEALRDKIRTEGPGKRSCVINFVCAFPDDAAYIAGKEPIIEQDPKYSANVFSKKDPLVRLPKFSVIMVNQACPLKCQMCYNWKVPAAQEENSLEDMQRFVSQCADLVGEKFEINLAGGEPFLRPEVFDLIRHIRSFGYTVSCTTNAFLLKGKLLDEVRASGLNHMPVSLDSLDPKIHDFLRGRPGTHQQVMDVFSELWKDRGCLKSLTIQTIIMKPNLDGIVDLVKWAHTHDISTYLMAIMRPVGIAIDPLWFQKKEHAFLWPDDLTQVYAVIDELIELKDQGFRIENKREQLLAFKEYFRNPTVFVKNGPCSLGDGIVNVGPDGNIYLCWEKGPIGNIKTSDIRELWYAPFTRERRKEILSCRRNCAEMVNCFFEE
jgi:MoaA/NifB/PqqE/SkfB family radical SAM enzyme